jgi:hypothetical protein
MVSSAKCRCPKQTFSLFCISVWFGGSLGCPVDRTPWSWASASENEFIFCQRILYNLSLGAYDYLFRLFLSWFLLLLFCKSLDL